MGPSQLQQSGHCARAATCNFSCPFCFVRVRAFSGVISRKFFQRNNMVMATTPQGSLMSRLIDGHVDGTSQRPFWCCLNNFVLASIDFIIRLVYF